MSDALSPAPSLVAPTNCLNCAAPLQGGYCHVCGQRADTDRFTMRRLWSQVFAAFVDVDRGFLYTLKVLTVAPGRAIKDYLAGHRAPMYNPFRFYILIAALAILALSLIKVDFTTAGQELNKSLGIGSAEPESLKVQAEINRWTQENMQTLQLLFLPLLAFGTWFAFRKRLGYNYAEVLVLQCYVSGYGSLVMTVITPLLALTPNPLILYTIISFVLTLVISIRLFSQLEGRFSFGVIWRYILSLISYVVLYLLILLVITVLFGIGYAIYLGLKN